MTEAKIVVDGLDLQASLLDTSAEVVGVIHLAIAIGDVGEIDTRHGETEGRSLVLLTIPQRLHDAKAAVGIHDVGGTTEDGDDLLGAETVEELRHPDDVVVAIGGELCLGVEQVHAEAVDAVGTWKALRLRAHHRQLLGQIDDGDFDRGRMCHTLQRPTSGVTTHVEQCAGLHLVEDDAKRLRERAVAVEMVEAEPTALHLGRQLGQPFIDRGPWAEMLQTRRTTFAQRLFEPEQTLVVDIVIEVEVGTRGGVGEQEIARLGNGEAVGVGIDKHGADGERCLEKHLHGIVGKARGFHDFGLRQAVDVVAQQVEDAELDHQTTYLEHHRAPRDELRLALGLAGSEVLTGVGFLKGG